MIFLLLFLRSELIYFIDAFVFVVSEINDYNWCFFFETEIKEKIKGMCNKRMLEKYDYLLRGTARVLEILKLDRSALIDVCIAWKISVSLAFLMYCNLRFREFQFWIIISLFYKLNVNFNEMLF